MAGREKIKCFEYSEKGKFLREYKSIADVRNSFFINDNGKKPLLTKENSYFKTPKNTFIANYRIGREKLLKLERISNCPFCNYSEHVKDRSFEVFNLNGEKIAEFKNAYIASKMLNISQKTIWARLNYSTSKVKNKPNKDNLEFKYKTI